MMATLLLRLERQGNAYAASCSTDGSNWQPIGGHTVDKAPVSIGLIAAQSTVASPYADFDYFEMTQQGRRVRLRSRSMT